MLRKAAGEPVDPREEHMPSHFVRLAVAGFAAASLLTPASWAQDKAPIKVGLAITQTGPFSPPAIFELRGYELAVDQINKAGGLLGRQIEIVKYDDQGNPSTAVQLYQ